jgi:hypothetical protein
MAIKTFTTGEVLTATDTNTYLANSGLVYVTSVTAGSAVSSVTVSSCFSATFDNYRIVISGGTSSAAGSNANFQLTGITGSTYEAAGYFVTYGVATVSAYAPAATTSWLVGFLGQNNTSITMDLINPFAAKHKGMNTLSSAQFNYSFTGQCTSTTSATGFTLTPALTTITGQTITVYGYRKA